MFTAVLVLPLLTASLRSKRPHCGRKWDCEDDNGWERFDDRTSALLEAAYQQGRPYIDYSVEGKPHSYRADFQRMVQRNLQTGREKPLRTLLALLIREKSGRITQTVEINMPHSTSIRELRKELAQYLKHDEKQLRHDVRQQGAAAHRLRAHHHTRRHSAAGRGAADGHQDQAGATWRSCAPSCSPAAEEVTAGVPGSASPATSWTAAPSAPYARRCVTRATSRACSPRPQPSFCHCGAGAGGYEAPCQALEESPGDREPTHPPSMCASACGQFVYTLSSDMGLVKLGTGGGAGDSCTGSLVCAEHAHVCACGRLPGGGGRPTAAEESDGARGRAACN